MTTATIIDSVDDNLTAPSTYLYIFQSGGGNKAH